MEESDAAFRVEYHDTVYDSKSTYILSFFSRDKTVSMYDVARKRTFLKRCMPPEAIKLEDLYVGTTVVVCGRALKVLDYADESTRRKFATTMGSVVVMVKPSSFSRAGEVLSRIYETPGLRIGRVRSVHLDEESAKEFLSLGKNNTSANDVSHMTSGNMLAIEVAGDDIIANVHTLIGPADPAIAREAAPGSIRAALGQDRVHNVVHTSIDLPAARSEIPFLFEGSLPATAVYNRCTLVLVKPHAITRGLLGPIVSSIYDAGLEVSGMRSLVLTRSDAADILEHYRTIYSEFERWVVEMSSGPSVAIEVRPPHPDANDAAAESKRAVDAVRALAGPFDPVIAKALRAGTWRALWGVDAVYNIVHVTDLPRDGPLESKFLFHVVGNRK